MQEIMAQEQSLASLIRLAQLGDRGAFDVIITTCGNRLESIVRSRLRPELRGRLPVAEVVQETWARAFESVSRYHGDDDDAWFAWLSGIAKNVVLKALSNLGQSSSLRLHDEPPLDAPSPGGVIRREERFERLRDAIQSLPDDYREVIQLCRIDGLKFREAAERMNRSTDAVKKLMWRALKELRLQFGDTESLGLPDRDLGAEGGRDAD